MICSSTGSVSFSTRICRSARRQMVRQMCAMAAARLPPGRVKPFHFGRSSEALSMFFSRVAMSSVVMEVEGDFGESLSVASSAPMTKRQFCIEIRLFLSVLLLV